MTASPPSNPGPDRLSIVVQSGAFDRVHYALVLAASALAINIPVTLFFTMWGCRALLRPGADGQPGWAAMSVSEPGITPAALDAGFQERGVGTFEELLQACIELGARFIVCESGLLGAGLDAAGLREDVPIEIAGAVTFLRDVSPNGTTLFV